MEEEPKEITFDMGVDLPSTNKRKSKKQNKSSKKKCRENDKENVGDDTNNDVTMKSDTDVDQIDQYLLDLKNQNTTYTTNSGCRRLNYFMKELDPTETRDFTELNINELEIIMCHFFMKAKKSNKKTVKKSSGKPDKDDFYEPETLTAFRNSWQRRFDEIGKKINIKIDPGFAKSRKVLASRKKELTQMGKGNKPNATRPLEDDEVNTLYEKGYFGLETPQSLQRTVWWVITTHFGYRARDESRKLRYGDIALNTDSSGKKYLEWDKERGSKTRTGESSYSHQRSFNPKAFETNDPRCPVKTFEKFDSLRPAESKELDSPFFLQILPDSCVSSGTWYHNRPMGHNAIGNMLSGAKIVLGDNSKTSRSKVSNHTARKTSISTLLDHDIHPLHVQQLSGHKNIESLNSYHSASLRKQKEMSDVLNSRSTVMQSNEPCQISSSNSSSSATITSQKRTDVESMFHGANFSNCTFNLHIHKSVSE